MAMGLGVGENGARHAKQRWTLLEGEPTWAQTPC
jgi:hypothetical protein